MDDLLKSPEVRAKNDEVVALLTALKSKLSLKFDGETKELITTSLVQELILQRQENLRLSHEMILMSALLSAVLAEVKITPAAFVDALEAQLTGLRAQEEDVKAKMAARPKVAVPGKKLVIPGA